MKKRYLLYILLIALTYGFYTQYPKLTLITGYSANNVCACVFVSKRELQSIEKSDNGFSPINLATNIIDYKNKTVTSSVFGFNTKTAIYREGFGCTLIGDETNFKPKVVLETPDLVLSDTLYWPYGKLENDSVFANVNYDSLKVAIANGFQKNEVGVDKTRSVVVVHKGRIIGEKYAEGFTKDMPLCGWSMTKSYLNTLVGMMVYDGNLSITEPLNLKEWKDDKRSLLTMEHLLHMNSGLKWEEDYTTMSPVANMLFDSKNMSQVARDCPAEFEPNFEWEYSSGTSNLISGILRELSPSDEAYWKMPYERIFNKLGMNSAFIELDAMNNYVYSSYGFATSRDYAKYGLLYLNDGVWNGERLLPENWVKYTGQPAPNSDDFYGSHFWLNVNKCRNKDVPADMISCNGFQGQRIFILPSNDLVIVRMGVIGDSGFDFNKFLKEIIASVE